MKQKLLFLLVSATLMMGFVACGDDNEPITPTPNGTAPHFTGNAEIRNNEIVILGNGVVLSSRCSGYSIMLAPRVDSLVFQDFSFVLNTNEYLSLGDQCKLTLLGNSVIELNKDATIYCSKLTLGLGSNAKASLTIRKQVNDFQQFYHIITYEEDTEYNLTPATKTDDGHYEVTWTVTKKSEET